MSVWWALAVVDRFPDVLPDVGRGAPLAVLPAPAGGAALVAAELAEMPAADLDALRWHDAIVRALASSTSAVLPVRFGAHASDPGTLAERLRGRERAISEALVRVREAVQVTVRARRGPALEVASDPDDARRGPGARFLARRARERSPRPPGWDERSAPLRPLLREERIERGDPRIESWRAYHLVPRASLDDYREAAVRVAAAAADWGLAFGEPSPPYAFAAEVVS